MGSSKSGSRPIGSKEIRRSISQVRSSVRGKVHKSVYVRVNNICLLIEQILPRANELGPGSEEMHVLTRMATDYLPDAINTYLSLPRSYAEHNRLSDGRTAIQILCAQLDVMYGQMQQVVEAVLRCDGDKLMANERFLEDKFGTNHNPLNLPPTSDKYATTSPPQTPPLSRKLFEVAAAHLREKMRNRKDQP